MNQTREGTLYRKSEMEAPLPVEFMGGVSSRSRVTDCPHNLYKYPARFAPEFAREAIRSFSRPGDLVLDVFQGGGTAIIEAIALGRRTVGYDISQLACFLARVKTTALSIHDERALINWATTIDIHASQNALIEWANSDTEDGYYRRNLPPDSHHFFAGIIAQLVSLKNPRQRRFARMVLLSVGQWALDCKKELPTTEKLGSEFVCQLERNVRAFRAYTVQTAKALGIPNRTLSSRRKIVLGSSERCGCNNVPAPGSVSLIVTSPPYPGVHMLYHRWQVLGRRETPVPFMIADCRDGDGISYYNLGHRGEVGLKTYYDRLTRIYAAAKPCLKPDAWVVQMVAFNNPEWQLPAYLEAMDKAGYTHVIPNSGCVGGDGHLWREVPGRKWYASTMKRPGAAGREVVLFHRPSAG